MFINFKVAAAAQQHFIISSVFLSIAMTADRVLALTVPIYYKNIKHFQRQTVAAVICFVLPIIVSGTTVGYFKILNEDDQYIAVVDKNFLASLLCEIVVAIEIALRTGSVACLIILNFSSVLAHRKYTKLISQMINNAEREAAQRNADKTILRLSVCQSTLTCINQLPHVLLHTLIYFPDIIYCYRKVASPIAGICIFITDSIDLFVVLCISKKMRHAVKIALFCCSADVVPT